MNLFKPEKDLIWRILNAVLLVWALVSLAVFINATVVETLIPEPSSNYEVYRNNYCRNYDTDKAMFLDDDQCKSQFDQQKVDQKYRRQRTALTSFISLIIPAGSLILFNLRPKNAKKNAK